MKIKKLMVTTIFMILFILFGTIKSNAGSLYLNNLDFNAQIKNDGSMDVVETWNINVKYTNTLYKSFKKDKSKYSSISNVTVKDITDENQIASFTKTDEWVYHVQKGYYYGTDNEDGNFEIGWGVGLDTTTANKKYQISYTVKDAITKYNDYAELYWQFVGKDFEVNASKITGTVYLPSNVSNKDEIKVWGHTAGLNGTIYATDTNKIQFEINQFKNGTYVEVRTLFPTSLISNSGRVKQTDILDKAVKEETKWADKANTKRKVANWLDENSDWFYFTVVIVIFGSIFLIVIIAELKQTKKYREKLQELENKEKIVASTKYEYFRDIPDENATPGEVMRILNPIRSQFSSSEFGKIFSATMLDLTLKKYLDIKLEKNQKNKDVTNIYVLKQVTDGLKPNEERIMTFIRNAAGSKKVMTLKELQNYIKEHPSKVESLLSSTFKSVETQLGNDEILDLEAYSDYSKYSNAKIGYIVLIIVLCWFVFAVIPIIAIVISAINAILCWKIQKKLSIFTQKGIDKQTEWKGLKVFMEEFSMLDKREVPELVIWEKYLVYATAMGVADKVIKQLKIVYPNFEEMTNGIETYSSGSGGGGGFSGGGGFGRRPEVAEAGR